MKVYDLIQALETMPNEDEVCAALWVQAPGDPVGNFHIVAITQAAKFVEGAKSVALLRVASSR